MSTTPAPDDIAAAYLNLGQPDVLATPEVKLHKSYDRPAIVVVFLTAGPQVINMHVRTAAQARALKEAFARAEQLLSAEEAAREPAPSLTAEADGNDVTGRLAARDQGHPTPRSGEDELNCGAVCETPDGDYICNAAAGHQGDHAAYAFGEGPDELCHTWPDAGAM